MPAAAMSEPRTAAEGSPGGFLSAHFGQRGRVLFARNLPSYFSLKAATANWLVAAP